MRVRARYRGLNLYEEVEKWELQRGQGQELIWAWHLVTRMVQRDESERWQCLLQCFEAVRQGRGQKRLEDLAE